MSVIITVITPNAFETADDICEQGIDKNGHKKTVIVSHNDGQFSKFQWLIYSIYTVSADRRQHIINSRFYLRVRDTIYRLCRHFIKPFSRMHIKRFFILGQTR